MTDRVVKVRVELNVDLPLASGEDVSKAEALIEQALTEGKPVPGLIDILRLEVIDQF